MFLLNQSTHRMLIQYDPDIGHRFVPNQKARLTNEAGGYYVVTNGSGFRSDHEFVAAKSDRPRILMFGDSYTAGDNVSNGDRYSDILAQLSGCEVYNFGISGSGTDQHLLAYRKFARDIEADLIVICVQVDSFHRIQTSHRPSIDRVTGRQVLVPKPYFELDDDGQLVLKQVPVPRDRKEAASVKSNGKRSDDLLNRVHNVYSAIPGLKQLRESPLLADAGSRLITEFRRIRGHHPYPDIESDQTPGWKLMQAIVQQFIQEARPLPVVIFPIPTRDFYEVGIEPIYQPLFEKLDAAGSGRARWGCLHATGQAALSRTNQTEFPAGRPLHAVRQRPRRAAHARFPAIAAADPRPRYQYPVISAHEVQPIRPAPFA